MINFNIYYLYFFILVLTKVTYQYIFNIDNRIEYYYNQTNYIKYKLLTYLILLINIVIMIYMKYILKELIYKYIN